MADIVILTDANFENEVFGSDIPVVVDFYADWCGPCKAMMPVAEKMAEKYTGEVKVCKVNVGEQRKLALTNKVMSVPTLFFVKGGEIVEKTPNVLTEYEFANKIEALKEI